MNLISVSINYRTAPVEIREAVTLSADEIKLFLKDLKGKIFSEGFIISTCNRTEVYGLPIDPAINFNDLQKFLFEKKSVENLTGKNFQNFFSCGAINHLFNVAAGIDSMLVGDNQIFGQVKEAFQLADENEFTGFLTKKIIDSTIRVGKRVKTETVISDGAITVSYAAVQLVEKIFSHLNKKSALVIGAGETGAIAAKHLRDKGISTLTITNRTIEKAEKLAKEINAKVIPMQYFREVLADYDIVISATSSPDLMLGFEDVKSAMKKRNNSATVLMDIAVPRDIDPRVKTLENVFYHDIDSLKIIVDQNLKKRQSEIPKVKAIIMEELVAFFSWYNSLEVAPTITSLRQHFENIRAEEVDKMKNKIAAEDVEKVDIITKRIINKILHQPTVELKKLTENRTDAQETVVIISAIKNLFGLNGSKQ